MNLSLEDRQKQEYYRDARFTKQYDGIWQSVGKCVFCDLKDKYIFFEENGVVMTISLFAYIDGHFMIVPRRHIRSIKELTQLEWDTVQKFSYMAKKLVRDVHDVKGLQMVQKDGSNAQSTVDQHLHFHCVPFDAPDLSVWNYRKLKYTPLENVALYKQARKKIIKSAQKFDAEYRQPDGLPVIVDVVVVNDKNEVLLQERSDDAVMVPPHDTTPGGHVDDFSHTLEEELARELREETGLTVDPAGFELVASRVDATDYYEYSPHLKVRYTSHRPVLWNTYRLTGIEAGVKLTPGDDAKRLYWLPAAEVATARQLTPALKDIIGKALSRG